MAITLLTRAGKGSPLTSTDHDTNLSAIETAINSVEAAASPAEVVFGGTTVTLASSPANNTQDVTGVSFINCTGTVTLYRFTGGVEGQKVFVFANGASSFVTIARLPRVAGDNIYINSGDTVMFSFDTAVEFVYFQSKWLNVGPISTWTF